MAFNSYSGLKDTIGVWLQRTSSSDDIQVYADDFIDIAEERLARDLRIRANEATLNVTLSGGAASIPSDFIEIKHVYIDGSPVQPLNPVPSDWLLDNYPTRSSDAKPVFLAEDGGSFIFGPYPDKDYVLKGVYYKRPAALSLANETNEWTDNCPDVLLWAALVETAPFLMNDQRIATWEAKYQAAKQRVNLDERKRTRRYARIRVS